MRRFAELSSGEKTLEVLRWVAVPLVAIGVQASLAIFWRVIVPPSVAHPPGTPVATPSDFYRYVLPRIFGVLIGFAFVFIAAKIASRRRVWAAVVLAGCWFVYCFFRFVVVHLGQGTPHYIDLALAAAAVLAGVAAVYYTEQSKGNINHG